MMWTFKLSISLYKHTHQMQNRFHGFRNANTEAHINALKTVIIFFCSFISYFAAFMANMTFNIPYGSQCFFVVKDIMAAFPSGHSVIIIWIIPSSNNRSGDFSASKRQEEEDQCKIFYICLAWIQQTCVLLLFTYVFCVLSGTFPLIFHP